MVFMLVGIPHLLLDVHVRFSSEKQMHFSIFHRFCCDARNEVTENVCGNPAFYVQDDKSSVFFLCCKWQIEKCAERCRKIVYPKWLAKYIGHEETKKRPTPCTFT